MKPFINDDFLLTSDAAKELFHNYAEKMPIIDYHCHLPPKEIADDKKWDNIAQVWLGGDHYKWRQMRTNGYAERLCSGRGEDGNAPDYEKFLAFAGTMERLVKNPLFDWSHLELARYFGVTDILNTKTAPSIWEKCNAEMQKPEFSARGLMRRSNVKLVCTTDDPVDSLEYHKAIAASGFDVKVLPAWRMDKAQKIAEPAVWNEWMDQLSAAAGIEIKTWDDFQTALQKRHDFFASVGSRLSDYGITEIFAAPYTESDIRAIFAKARSKEQVTGEEELKFKSAWLYEGLVMDAKADWTTQLHFGCLRDNNKKMFRQMGPDTGFDCIGDWSVTESLTALLNRLEENGTLPRTILYSLNPKDNEVLATLMGCFQKGPDAGRLQLGAAWWFLDQKDGMRRQIEALGQLGTLGRFVGMLTDSRSFLSYTRHEYFRRLLCKILGEEIERGELPDDIAWIGSIVSDISFNNANAYFKFNV
ncbi:MAG: glucuronate isomerase [Kiritimatiellae bacterium]|nr:glucuronate isomerase [Kiritimatiellia bacterium]